MAAKEFASAARVYELLLAEFPRDARAREALDRARRLERSCAAIVGQWKVRPNRRTWTVHEDGTVYGTWLIFNSTGVWECVDPQSREFVVRWPRCVVCGTEYFVLSDDHDTLQSTSTKGGSTATRVADTDDTTERETRPAGDR